MPEAYGVFEVYHLGFSSKQFQSCNKSLINQACSGPSWENISPWSFLYGPRCTRSVLSRPRADILPVRPSCLVNKIYICYNKHFLKKREMLHPQKQTHAIKLSHPYLPTMAISLQWPLSFVPTGAIVEKLSN